MRDVMMSSPHDFPIYTIHTYVDIHKYIHTKYV